MTFFFTTGMSYEATANCDAESANPIVCMLTKEVKTLKGAKIALYPDNERLEQCKRSKTEGILIQIKWNDVVILEYQKMRRIEDTKKKKIQFG